MIQANKRTCIVALWAVTILSVFIVYLMVFPVEFTKLQGLHSWLSASTIKFTNMWLAEGPVNLKFFCYEAFPSIEMPTLADRTSYVSYPPGTILFTYLAALLCGKHAIDIVFVKQLQLLLYALQCVFLVTLIFLMFQRIWPKKYMQNSIASYLLILCFMLLPGNAWYLLNVFYSDQLVLTFVALFLLVVYLLYCAESRRSVVWLRVAMSVLIFAGMLIDYYFWILAFVAFVINLAADIRHYRDNRTKEARRRIFMSALWYVVPVALAVGLYVVQLCLIEDGFDKLFYIFFYRVGAREEVNAPKTIKILQHFRNLYAYSGLSVALLSAFVGMLAVCAVLFVRKNKAFGILRSPIAKVAIIALCAPLMQVLILRQHSAFHEFGVLKFSQTLVILFAVGAILLGFALDWFGKRKNIRVKNAFMASSVILVLLFVAITRVPRSTGMSISDHIACDPYSSGYEYGVEKSIKQVGRYEDVFFSFTKEIPLNPPQCIAVSEKLVYRIDDVADIDSIFPNIDSKANILLLYDKTVSDRDSVTGSREASAIENLSLYYEDDNIKLYKLR